MKTHRITRGSRVVIVTEQDGRYEARLYVNGGETATMLTAKAKTYAGIQRSAERLLSK